MMAHGRVPSWVPGSAAASVALLAASALVRASGRPVDAAWIAAAGATGLSAVLVSVAWRLIVLACPALADPPLSVRLVLGACAVLFLAGAWWGWPGGAWAADEILPPMVLDGVSQGFSGGWFHPRYGPVHFYMLAATYAPMLAAGRFGLIDPNSALFGDVLHMEARVLSIALSIGTLTAVAALARQILGQDRAWAAALCAGLFLPLVFYAKTANVDAPSLFWFALSLVFLADAHRTGERRAMAGVAATAALAFATKETVGGLYVLPAAHLVWRMVRQRQLAPLGWALLAGTVTLIASYNVVFNFSGVMAHVGRFNVLGTGARHYRMFPITIAGEVALAARTTELIVWMLGGAGSVLVGVGLAVSVLERRRDTPRLPLWLLLIPLSYYLTFLTVAGWVYDRFLLPMNVVLALPAAIGLGWLLQRRRGTTGLIATAAAVVLLAALVWRAASIDALLIRDGRYRVEAWLRDHTPRDGTIAYVGDDRYLPRLSRFSARRIYPDIPYTLARQPEFIVVNTEFLTRYPPGSGEDDWCRWLEGGKGPYREVYRYKRPLSGTTLQWDPRFTDGREDPFTNLDKANPEIAVYRLAP